MYEYDFYSFIDSPDIREYLKKFYPTIAKQAVLIARSERKSVNDKIYALQYLLDSYTCDEIMAIGTIDSDLYDKDENLTIAIMNQIHYWSELLEKNKEPNRVYAVRYTTVGNRLNNASNAYFTSYEKAFNYLKQEQEDYNNENIYGIIESFADEVDITIKCYFDSDLIMYDIDHSNDEDGEYKPHPMLDEYYMFIPLPFKCGDIVKEVSIHGVRYGVFPKDWEYTEERKGMVTDYYTVLDSGEIDRESNNVSVYWLDSVYIPHLQYCSEDELPDKYSILKYISDVRLGECDMISLLNDITTDHRAIKVSDICCTGKGFKK